MPVVFTDGSLISPLFITERFVLTSTSISGAGGKSHSPFSDTSSLTFRENFITANSPWSDVSKSQYILIIAVFELIHEIEGHAQAFCYVIVNGCPVSPQLDQNSF